MHTLGWIGLGLMGRPMAANLVKKGNQVNVYNRSLEKTASLVELGAYRMNSPRDLTENSDIIFMMLSDASAVKEVLTQSNGVLESVRPGKVIVDMSTIAPADSVSFSKLVADKGGIYLDAPVSGSVGAAQSGQLVVLVGGENEAIETCQPYFDVLGKGTIHFGTSGKGSSAKLAVNLLLGIMGQGFGEVMLFADKMGLSRDKIIESISMSAMSNLLFQWKKDMYSKEKFPAAFMLELMCKDLGLIRAEADRLETILPLADTVNRTYLSAKANGKGKLDMAAVYLELKDMNKK